MTLLSKLNEFRKQVEVVKKDAKNPFYKSNYATLEAVIETIEPVLDNLQINYLQIIEGMTLKTIIYDVDNEADKIESTTPLLIAENDMQKLGSAITYARRYSLVALFNLEQEDDDGNKTLKDEVLNTFKNAKVVNKPAIDDIAQYIMTKNYMNVNAKSIFSYLESKGWKDKNGGDMTDATKWQRLVDYFENNKK